MAAKEKMLSKAEIDEYIRLHYKLEKKLGKSFLGILKGTGACLGGAIYTGAQRLNITRECFSDDLVLEGQYIPELRGL